MTKYYVFCDLWLIESYTRLESAKRLACKLASYNEHGKGEITIYKSDKDGALEPYPCFVAYKK